MKNSHRLISSIGLLFLVAQTLLVILSWLLSAMRTEGVRSLLSGEGIRWFIGTISQIFASPLLVSLLLLLIAWGSLRSSGVLSLLSARSQQFPYRDRVAMRVSLVFLLLYVGVIALLTLVPHALLLSATGHLFPSSFSRSLIPLSAFGVTLFSAVFGLISGRQKSLSDVFYALSSGLSVGAPLILLCLLFLQFYASFLFVFGN